MSLLEGLALANFALGVFDGWLTQRRMTDYGPEVELNSLIVSLAKIFNPQVAVLVVCILFAGAQSLLCTLMDWPSALAFLVGFRFKLLIGQVQSLFFEAQLKKFTKMLEEKQKLEGGVMRPPSPHSDSQESPSQPPSNLDKDSQ